MFLRNNFFSGSHKPSTDIHFKQKKGARVPYKPTEEEINLALKARDILEQNLGFEIKYFRFDFLKSQDGIEILEFEGVNPSFHYAYLAKEDVKDKHIEFINFLESEYARYKNSNKTTEGVYNS